MADLQNVEAEKAIIHILCHHPKRIGEVDGKNISEMDFTKRAFREVFLTIKHLYMNGSDVNLSSVLTVGKEFKFSFVNKENNVAALTKLFEVEIEDTNLLMHCGIVRNISIKKQLTNRLSKLHTEVGNVDTAHEALSLVEKAVYNFASESNQGSEIIRLADRVDEVMKDIEANPTIGLSSGFPTYDKAIGGGLRPGTINMIGARPKKGKSLISLWMAIHNAKNGIPTLYLDTELEYKDQIPRMIGMLAGISFENIETGKWQRIRSDVEKYKQAREVLENMPLYWIKIAGMQIEEVIGYIRRFICRIVGTREDGRPNRSLICYDYLKLMNTKDLGKSMQEYQALGYRISELHDLAGEMGAAMLMTVQLNRDGIEREDGASISGSDRTLWLCDNFTILKPLSREEISLAPPGVNYKLFVSDTRYGAGNTEIDFIGLNADKTRGQFSDMGLIKILKEHKEDDNGGHSKTDDE